MANRVTQTPLIIPNENLGVPHKKAGFEGNVKSSRSATKKGGLGLGNRKALNDITNKASLPQDVSSQKNGLPLEEFNVAEEMFLHDHKKCIEAQQTASDGAFWLDLVLPGHDSVSTAEQVKTALDSPCLYSELEELSMSEFCDCFKSSTHWDSPPCSPISWDSPPSSPFVQQFEEVEFMLKEENNV